MLERRKEGPEALAAKRVKRPKVLNRHWGFRVHLLNTRFSNSDESDGWQRCWQPDWADLLDLEEQPGWILTDFFDRL